MKEFLDKIFKLPPVEKRPDIHSGWRRYVTGFFPMGIKTIQKDDVYIYYQLFSSVLMLCLTFFPIIMAVLFTKSDINLVILKVVSSDTDNLKTIFQQYIESARAVVLWVLYPFFFIKFRRNIDVKKYDVLAYNPKFAPGQMSRSRLSVLIWFSFGTLVFFFGQKYVYLLPNGVGIRLFFSENLASALMFYLAITWLFCILSLGCFLGFVIITGYSGKSQSSQSS